MKNNINQTNSEAYDKWHQSVHGQDVLTESKLEGWHIDALSLSPSLKDLNVLEVGCGAGDFAIHLSKQQAIVTAVDFSAKAVEIAKEKSKAQSQLVDFQVADAQSLPFSSNSFDLIFSCECLEHVPDPQKALNEFYRVLKPSGYLILTTENYSNAMILAWIVAWLRKESFNSGAGIQPIDHFFLYWNVRKMFIDEGFKVLEMIGWHHVFLMLPRFDPRTFVKERFHNSIAARLFLPLARHMAFKCIKE